MYYHSLTNALVFDWFQEFAKRNGTVQQQLFNRLSFLMSIPCCEQEVIPIGSMMLAKILPRFLRLNHIHPTLLTVPYKLFYSPFSVGIGAALHFQLQSRNCHLVTTTVQ